MAHHFSRALKLLPSTMCATHLASTALASATRGNIIIVYLYMLIGSPEYSCGKLVPLEVCSSNVYSHNKHISLSLPLFIRSSGQPSTLTDKLPLNAWVILPLCSVLIYRRSSERKLCNQSLLGHGALTFAWCTQFQQIVVSNFRETRGEKGKEENGRYEEEASEFGAPALGATSELLSAPLSQLYVVRCHCQYCCCSYCFELHW